MKPSGWSVADSRGISTLVLDMGAVSTLRGRRRCRAWRDPVPPDAWPSEWRALLTDWLRKGGGERRWETLLKIAGNARYTQAEELRDALLAGGWVELEERFQKGGWQTKTVTFIDLSAARRLMGLSDPDAQRQAWCDARASHALPPDLALLLEELDDMPPARALTRLALLTALAHWCEEGRDGTWRDFAQFARHDTKAISDSERAWLEERLDMATRGVSGHIPLLHLRAPLGLIHAGGRLDLASLPGFVGLAPETVVAITAMEGRIAAWRLVENRTSFERVAARYGDSDGVLWLPGFAPEWWKACVAHMVALMPAPALIACDPDPAGISIALDAAQLFDAAGVPWSPWCMSDADLATLPHRRPLTEVDHSHLSRLEQCSLPEPLARLAAWMRAHGEKGEQEALL